MCVTPVSDNQGMENNHGLGRLRTHGRRGICGVWKASHLLRIEGGSLISSLRTLNSSRAVSPKVSASVEPPARFARD
jgi:hypothetical protein